jgi:hypothetical protein
MKARHVTVAAVLLLGLFVAVPCAGLTLFHAHFNGDTVTTEGGQPAIAEGIQFAPGRCGTQGLLVGDQTKLSYTAPGNASLYQGTAMVWCKPIGWRGGPDKATRWVWLWRPEKTNKASMIGLVQNSSSTVNVHMRDAEGASLCAMTRPANVFQDQTWVHLAAAWSAFEGVLRLFVNGREVDDSRLGAPLSINLDEIGPTFSIGGTGPGALDAVMDEFVISDKFLEEDGVLREMRKPIAAYTE